MPDADRIPGRRAGASGVRRLEASNPEHVERPSRGRAFVTLMRRTWQEYERDHARYFAVAMVYYALISLIPLLLLMTATLGLLLRFSGVAAVAEQQLLAMVDAQFGGELRSTVEGLSGHLQRESFVATWISIGGLLVTASVLFRHLRLSFRALWHYAPPLASGSVRSAIRETFLERAMGFVLVFGAGVLLIVALVLIAVLQWLSGLFGRLPFLSHTPSWLMAMPALLGLVILTFAFLFMLLPPVRPAWRHVWPAAVLCATVWFIGAEMLTLFGANAHDGLSAYGAIGAVLVLMLWMNIVSQVLFFGAELCKVMSTDEAARSGSRAG